jgi:hypothetical protein
MSVQLVHSARPDGHRCLITWGEAMRDTRRVAAALAAGLLLLTACASSDDGSDDAPPIGGDEDDDSDDVETEDEEEDEDEEEPFAVPDEIDEDYAENVINALLEIDTEILVTALRQEPGETLDVEATDRLHAISDGNYRESSMRDLQEYIDAPETADGFLPPDEIEPSRVEVDAILHEEPENCLMVAGWWDLRGTAREPLPPEERALFSLGRVDQEVTDRERNPTPWQLRDLGLLQSGGEPIPEEQWGDLDFEAFDNSCEES